jgi:hypothetical protein
MGLPSKDVAKGCEYVSKDVCTGHDVGRDGINVFSLLPASNLRGSANESIVRMEVLKTSA